MKKSRFDREIKKTEFRVTLFGSARIKKNTKEYAFIRGLAKMIGARGIDIVTGGGPGLMDAASAGHAAGMKESGLSSHSLGLLINLPREKANRHLNIQHEFSRFSERLDTFMRLSNVVVVAPGGLGTLLEFFYTWQLIQVKQLCDIPIILLGDHYKELVNWIRKGPLKNHYLNEEDFHPIFFAKTSADALKIIDQAYDHYKQGGTNICLNIKKYRVK